MKSGGTGGLLRSIKNQQEWVKHAEDKRLWSRPWLLCIVEKALALTEKETCPGVTLQHLMGNARGA